MPAHPGLTFDDLCTLLRRSSPYREDPHQQAAVDMLIEHNGGHSPWLRTDTGAGFRKTYITGKVETSYVVRWDAVLRATNAKEPKFPASRSEILFLRTAAIIGSNTLDLLTLDVGNRQLVVQAFATASGDRSADIAVVHKLPGTPR